LEMSLSELTEALAAAHATGHKSGYRDGEHRGYSRAILSFRLAARGKMKDQKDVRMVNEIIDAVETQMDG